MPSVSDIDKRMKCWSQEWTEESSLSARHDAFNALWKITEKYFGSNYYCIRPNYERILGEMIALSSWISPVPFGTPLTGAVRDSNLARELDQLLRGSDHNAPKQRVLEQYTFLFERLANHMRQKSIRLDPQSNELWTTLNAFETMHKIICLNCIRLRASCSLN